MVIPENPVPDTKQKKKEPQQVSATACSNCGTTTTPLWRRAPNGDTICNACGLYLKARNTLRPPSMKRNFKSKQDQLQEQMTHNTINAAEVLAGTCPGGGQCNGTGGSPSCEGCPAFNQHQVNRHALICANCRTTTTPLWRRDEEGNTICNACGLYYKLHNVHRPVSMKRSVIKRRKRIIVNEHGEGEEEEDELESSSEGDHVDSDDEEKVKQAAEKKEKKKRRVVNTTVANIRRGSNSNAAVPPIEDYIEPKRAPYQAPLHHATISQVPPSQPRLPPPPRTPPTAFHQPSALATTATTSTARNLPLVPDINRSLPPPAAATAAVASRFDPLSDYRSTSSPQPLSSQSSPTSQPMHQKMLNLPPIAAIGPTTAIAAAGPPSAQTPSSNNPYADLTEFDHAMTRLERLRRRVPPEQCQVLSRLTHSLEDVVAQAETILQSTNTIQQQPQQHYHHLQRQLGSTNTTHSHHGSFHHR
ncbi:hypothetical protein MAM1_0262c08887 [Mucor ambiguus]|uniref:GATA-type domain-containing protein n=1 Tax=Mucor ambiguus TaxID=91626 RepID=A0A0C9MF97_9FUNG|nr:hypothetical protein MAM1_0262c08887 [Mucor ambiguus]